ncbi:Lipopolysaccharide kinase (Kdo/WaaP) family protein [Bowdeniella nasicola]|uniref:Lipopolysaccharide kinase (Kdo/WaaP) family protein n=1 Tax=Bowdeniella nasicola TaxID=208480 RepID=A0A1H3ZH43_9ACTO|nr:DUF4032 domain-containing protein [Bowdeniella nasicola]SEA22977.1 Lipopolysaccharide kinase (Kdo/WaaP) family protein [Bowdeniella nasicola]
MVAQLQITAASLDPALLDLPWELPLEEWPESVLAALPRGISRHIVRFAKLSGRVVAVKEIGETVAHREYEMLRALHRLGAPSVLPMAVITGRRSADGEELTPALVTQHLSFSLPYRALYSRSMRPETGDRLVDALAVLLVRLHTLGFYWGDVSLSNTLFRRDAGAFAAYLVDAETGELHPRLTVGQREYDVDLARTNIIGELMDLQAGGVIDESEDLIAIGDRLVERYHSLWNELTASEAFDASERWRVAERINRLNALGYDVDEIQMTTDADGTTMHIQPKIVDAGHYHRQVMRLTGLDVQENQGRRMLNDLESYRVITGRSHEPIEIVAHDWVTDVFEPTVRAVPRELSGKLEPAEIFHEVLEHRWYMSEQQQRDVPTDEAVASYVADVLPTREDEHTFLSMGDTQELEAIHD